GRTWPAASDRPFTIGRHEFTLHGRVDWDRNDLDRQLSGQAGVGLALLDAGNGATILSSGSYSATADGPRVRQATLDPAACSAVAAGDNWRIVVAPRRPSSAARQARRIWWIGAIAAGLLAFPIAWLLTRREREPLTRLQQVVDEIGAGGADYTFSAPTDRVDQLAVTFSELRRTLDEQTERARLAERVSAWSDVARHVAHEVKNPLVPIRLTIQNIQRARERAPEQLDDLLERGSQTILEEVEQLDRLVASFAEFARLPAPQFCDTNLVELVSQTLDLYDADDGLSVARDLPEDAPIEADPDQLLRVLKNIVGNAVEAMRDLPDRRLVVTLVCRSGGYELSVADSGPGLQSEDPAAVFHEGFTTKADGSGLGLAISRRIVAEHHGWIRLESASSGGLRVRIGLPRKKNERGE
ncbi:MAG: ATP-binding protein, partial [Acidobacteriota bacterium]|nr:ATP-binding protein [Acidobacteriota bacterium]